MATTETDAPPTDTGSESPGSDEETPEIEADLIQEELRIDGICGVY